MLPVPDPGLPEDHRADDDASFVSAADLLGELACLGMELARLIVGHARNGGIGHPDGPGGPDPSLAFARVSRSVRLTILLARHIDKPSRPDRAASEPKAPLHHTERPERERADRRESVERVESIGQPLATPIPQDPPQSPLPVGEGWVRVPPAPMQCMTPPRNPNTS